MTKDFLAFLNHIEKIEVTTKEAMTLIYLFKQHNVKYGYAYPTFKNIGQATKTKSDKTIENTIESLEKKGLVKVDRTNKNNRYYIVGIEQFLLESKAKKVVKKTKEVVKKTIEKVVKPIAKEVKEVSVKEKEVVDPIVEETNTFKPSFVVDNDANVEKSNVIEKSNVVENKISAIDRFKNMIFSSMQDDFNNDVKEVIQVAKSEGVEGGTLKGYERLVRIYGKREVIRGIGNAVALSTNENRAFYSKIVSYLEKLDKKMYNYVITY